jgi:Rab GDP dissociation inhibitor
VTGVTASGETAKCTAVIGDPSYFSDKVKQVGQIVRCINILNHPLPNTNGAESVQIIIPNAELKRKNGIDIFLFSFFLCDFSLVLVSLDFFSLR